MRGADAYAGGVEFALKLLPHGVRVSYQYAHIGQDTLFGQFMDGGFGGASRLPADSAGVDSCF
jgi:hypothetical protein